MTDSPRTCSRSGARTALSAAAALTAALAGASLILLGAACSSGGEVAPEPVEVVASPFPELDAGLNLRPASRVGQAVIVLDGIEGGTFDLTGVELRGQSADARIESHCVAVYGARAAIFCSLGFLRQSTRGPGRGAPS